MKEMTVIDLVVWLLISAETDDPVDVTYYTCGCVHQVPLTGDRLAFEKGRIIIKVEDN